jgi:hypothetical protein
MTRRFSFVFVCDAGKLELQALLLAASLRRHLRCPCELIAAIPQPRERPRDTGTLGETIALLEDLGVGTAPIENPLDADYPIANKLACVALPTTAEKRVFLDSDILLLRDFRDAPRFDAPFHAKPADRATFTSSAEVWRRACEAVGIAPPALRVPATVSGEYMPPYFNSGVLVLDSASDLHSAWLQCARRLDEIPELPNRRPHLDQIALAVAVAQLGLRYRCLDERDNFPAHRKPLPEPPPVICHYHEPAVVAQEPALRAELAAIAAEHPAIAERLAADERWQGVLARRNSPTAGRLPGRARPPTLLSVCSLPGHARPPTLLITGIPRSGTSYLCSLLDRFANVAAVNEPRGVLKPLASQRIPWDVARLHRELRRRIADGLPIENKVRDGVLVEDTRGEGANRPSEHVAQVSGPDFVLATKNTLAYLARIEGLRRALPDARIIACVRDPLATIASWKTSFPHLRDADVAGIPVGNLHDPHLPAWRRDELQLIAATLAPAQRRAMWWRFLAELLLDQRDRVQLVRYAELVSRPDAVIGAILEGIDAGAPSTPLAPSSERGRFAALDDEDIQAVDAICSVAAAELGVTCV